MCIESDRPQLCVYRIIDPHSGAFDLTSHWDTSILCTEYAIIHSMYHVCVVYCFHYLLRTSYLNTYVFPYFLHQLINEAFLKDFMEHCTEVMLIKHGLTHQKMMYLYSSQDRH